MRIVGRYSFNRGAQVVGERYAHLLAEIEVIVNSVDAASSKQKRSKEKTMIDKLLFSPPMLNRAFDIAFQQQGWQKQRILCDYPTQFYVDGYQPGHSSRPAYREMDFIKEKLGVEVQLGKYSFMVYNVAAKMTIFRNLGYIDAGVEIVPVKEFAGEMSTGVSYFEQFVWDLEQRGTGDIDVPVLILGILP